MKATVLRMIWPCMNPRREFSFVKDWLFVKELARYVPIHPSEIPAPHAYRRNSDEPEESLEQPDTEPDAPEKINQSQPRSDVDYSPTSPRGSEVPETPPEPFVEAPENIPAPVEEEDDLVCDAYALDENLVWRFEVNKGH